ncbi:MAG: double-strand break repair protein AddB, partial [Alphaproteobacteria bacterium]|nr:double-strand break repair protein AddB [Alphaproteobacteria bacterium]
MTAAAPRVFTIAPGVAFVDALAAGLIAEVGADRLALARMTVLLPTRRAGRALQDAFRRHAAGEALLLPRLVPIGDIEEDVLEAEAIAETGAALDILPAIAPLRRRLLLARLILEVPTLEGIDAAEGPAQASRLAAELARFLDEVETERLDLATLAGLVPERYAEHWQRSLRFLDVLTTHWPRILAEEGALDPARRRNRLIAARIEAWRRSPPADPVIAAGSTGSIPATADLLALVARLPRGAVVLPGFDRALDPPARQALVATHPQYGMQRLIDHIGVAPEAVADWPSPVAAGSPPSRAYVLDAALHPTADPARGDAGFAAGFSAGFAIDALGGVERIDCPGAHEEAAVIALLMRETLERRDATAALVTPDRALARRVAAELRRWDIAVDD